MKQAAKKLIRTLQCEVPFLQDLKDRSFLHWRRLLRIPHEADFLFIREIPDRSDRCYVDIGANQGQSIESILLLKPNAQIVAFEPNTGLAEKLHRRYRNRPNVRVVGKGLADRNDTFTLFVPSYKGWVYDGAASFDRETASWWLGARTVYGFKQEQLKITEMACAAETLDGQNLKPAFIKIDVQGYEYQVLAGARDTIAKYRPVILIEDFRGDSRTVSLATELDYEEHYFDGTVCRKGMSQSVNSVLLPAESVGLSGRG